MQSSVDPKADENEPNVAREGTIWMCGGCGRMNKDRDKMGDSACHHWAVLVYENSIKHDESGRAIGAEAVNDPEAELTW